MTIEVKNLTKRYGQNKAVDDISFEIKEGQIVGFLGPNGAGKTTTMNILTGYLSASEGSCKIGGKDILDEPYEVKKLIGYLPEQPPLYHQMTVEEYLKFIFDLKKVKLPKDEHIESICRLVKIDHVYKRVIQNLSKGYKQRVGIAQALIGNPPVLILDEPTVGLDPNQIIEIRSLIKRLGESHTVILSSHILSEVQAVCDRIIIINNGKIVTDSGAENLTSEFGNINKLTVRIMATDESAVFKTLSKIPGTKKVSALGVKETGSFDFEVESDDGADIRNEIVKRVLERGWQLLMIRAQEATLEDIFIKLVNTNSNKGGKK
ncbi:MAG: ATP-binding cassette domain-containing protein [Oscillospiraceae bacterium]|nr:ATP-binding cassette domain-containing protein [Oscillospiraceae bacterium]